MNTLKASDDLFDYLTLYCDVLNEIVQDVAGLSDADGAKSTDCPGWTVKDQISHIVGLEQSLGGAPEPDVTLPDYDHVSGDFPIYMESHVEARRALPVVSVIDELTSMTPRRITQVENEVAQGDIEVAGPLGSSRKLSVNMPIRVLDLYAHQLDIARALDRELPVDGHIADFVIERCFLAWNALLPRKAEGAGIITLGIGTPHEYSEDIDLGHDAEGESVPQAAITGSRDTMLKLAMGRGDLDQVLNEANVSGDSSVIDAVKPLLAFTP